MRMKQGAEVFARPVLKRLKEKKAENETGKGLEKGYKRTGT